MYYIIKLANARKKSKSKLSKRKSKSKKKKDKCTKLEKTNTHKKSYYNYIFDWKKKSYIFTHFTLLNTVYLENNQKITTLISKNINQLYNMYIKTKPSKLWLKKQITYIKGLSKRDKEIIKNYSYGGDSVINYYIANGKNPKDAIQQIKKHKLFKSIKGTISQKIKYASNRLVHIINNAPQTKSTFQVYRGMSKFYNSTRKQINSFSLDVYVAEFFSTEGKLSSTLERNIIVATIPKNTQCLYIAPIAEVPEETEIIFPPSYSINLKNASSMTKTFTYGCTNNWLKDQGKDNIKFWFISTRRRSK